MRILLVEDDGTWRRPRQGCALGFTVDWLRMGAVETAIASAAYDAVVLDLGLPDDDGLMWLKRWRDRAMPAPC
jgi:two-component system response regulator QseB